jgi:hypothetical protein
VCMMEFGFDEEKEFFVISSFRDEETVGSFGDFEGFLMFPFYVFTLLLLLGATEMQLLCRAAGREVIRAALVVV